MKESDYYVGIVDHQFLRKNLLESTKGTIKILQRLELIKSKREQKIIKLTELKKLVEDINYLIENLKKELPKVDSTVHVSKPKGRKVVSKKEILEKHEEEKETARKTKKTVKKATKKVAKKVSKKKASKKSQSEAQLNIKESKDHDLHDLENELNDIEAKLRELNN